MSSCNYIRQSFLLLLGLIFLSPNTYSQKSLNSDSIYVIVGSFKNQYNAIYLERDLRKKGYKNAVSLNRKNGFYRVSIERFSEINKAKKFIEDNQLKKSEFWYQYSNGKVINNYDEKSNNTSAGILSKFVEKSDKEDKLDNTLKEPSESEIKEITLKTKQQNKFQNKPESEINIIDTTNFQPQLTLKENLESEIINEES